MNYISEQLNHTLDEFESDNLGEHYKGKVRENFSQRGKKVHLQCHINGIQLSLSE